MTNKKNIAYRKKLAAVFASFSILIMGTISLSRSMSLDYYTVLSTLNKVIPAALILGTLGWVMGMILDRPRRRKSSINYNKLFLNDVNKEGFPDVSVTPAEPNSDLVPQPE